MLRDLQPGTMQQGELAVQDDEPLDRCRLMTTMNGLNLCYRRGTVLMASAGLAGLVDEAGPQDAAVHDVPRERSGGAGVRGRGRP